MTLPYDYARCKGLDIPLCQDCRRREPGHPERQSYMQPPAWTVDGEKKCEWKIEREKKQ